MAEPLLRVRGLRKEYASRTGWLGRGGVPTRAVDDISFEVLPGETLGLVGESGSGKSTTGRLVMRLEEPSGGEVSFEGQVITGLSAAQMKPIRRRMQIVFQDPYAALSPRMRVGRFVGEPLIVHGSGGTASQRRDIVAELFRQVGLQPDFMSRYPHEFSGGQRQRIVIARAIALEPSFIVADEPITALDVSIQAQIVNLFQDLRERLGLAYLFIAHDLSMVRYLCQRVAVLLRGRIVEIGPTEAIFADPRHPYTQALLSAVPIPDPDVETARRRLVYDPDQAGLGGTLEEVTPGHWTLR